MTQLRPNSPELAGRPRVEASSVQLGSVGLATLLLGLLMAIVDFFIVNIALPSIESELGASTAELELVVAGYGASYAALLVLGGRLGDRFGRRRAFLTGVAGFTAASALCGLAPSAPALVALRVVQGSCAALLVPQVLAIIQASLQGSERQRALAAFGATLGAGAVIGQLTGGLLVQLNLAGLGWRPIFLVNLPIGMLTFLAAAKLAPSDSGNRHVGFDLRGTLLVALSMVATIIPVTLGRDLGWPLWSLAMLPISPLAIGLALWWGRRLELAGREPLLPPSLLAIGNMRAGIGVAVLLFLAAGGFFLTIALTLQDGLGLSPFEAALSMVPFATTFLITSIVGRRLAERWGGGLVQAGGALFASGMALIALVCLVAGSGLAGWMLLLPLAVVGTGQGAVVAPLIGIALAGVPAHRAGAASGLMTTTIQASLAVGAALIGLVFVAVLGGTTGAPAAAPGSTASQAAASAAGLQALLGLGVAWFARSLPRGAREAPGAVDVLAEAA
jgi:MFS family permease